jgi:hypothetical protein
MQINCRAELKSFVRVVVIGFFALNLLALSTAIPETRPVEVAVSVCDADTSAPISNAIASWQRVENDTGDLDYQRIAELFSDASNMSSSNAGVLSPEYSSYPWAWTFAAVARNLGIEEAGIPCNVIGITTGNGRLEFPADFPIRVQWFWPFFGYVHADDRLLQIDAVGYKTKSIRFGRKDFHVVDGAYSVNATVRLERDAT